MVGKYASTYLAMLLLLSSACAMAWQAQPSALLPSPVFRTLGNASELPQSTAYDIFQDSQGFIWLATEEGLVRYDGKQYKVFKHNPEDSTSIGNNWVRKITEAPDGYLWVACQNGLYRYSSRTETFENFTPASIVSDSTDLVVTDLVVAGQQYLFARINSVQFSGVASIDLGNLNTKLLSIPEMQQYSSFSNRGLLFAYQKVYVAAYYNLLQIDPATMGTCRFKMPTGAAISNIGLGKPGELWLASSKGGILSFNMHSAEFNKVQINPLADNSKVAVVHKSASNPGTWWLGTLGEGVFRARANRQGKMEATRYQASARQEGTLASNRIISIFEDRQGQTWLGTDIAVNIYTPDHQVFGSFSSQNLPALSSSIVLGIVTDSTGQLWAGTDKGLLRAKLQAGVDQFSARVPAYKLLQYAQIVKAVQNRPVRSLFCDREGYIWAGTDAPAELFKFLPDGQLVKKITIPLPAGANTAVMVVNDMARLSATEYLLVHSGQLSIYNEQTGQFTFLQNKLQKQCGRTFSAPGFHGLAVARDGPESFWLATFTGLLHYNHRTGTFRHVRNKPGQPGPFPVKVSCLYVGPDGRTVWAGTFGEGLFRYNKLTKEFTHLDERNGLGNNMVYSILPDKNQHLWMSTNNGVCRLDLQDSTFHTFRVADGLPVNEFNKIAHHRSRSGELFFGSDRGLLFFNPEKVSITNFAPATVFTSLQINYSPAKPGSRPRQGMQHGILFAKELHLYPEDKVVTFEFAALDFVAPQNVRYACKLEGFDEDWLFTNALNPRATYSSLPAGKYRFVVNATNSQGQWKARPATINITVHPPFWQTTWFIAISIILLTGIAASAATYTGQARLKRKIKEMEIQQRMQTERERIARDLHDNIGSKLAYITYHLEQVDQELKAHHPEIYEKEQTSQLQQLNNFARETIGQLRQTIWAINQQSINLEDFESRLRQFCWKYFGLKHSPAFLFDSKLRTSAEIGPSQALNLFRMVQEALGNALQHSGANKVKVLLEQPASGLVQISIEDNGKGFMPGQVTEADHYGLQNLETRAKEAGGQLQILSAPGKGTTVKIIFSTHKKNTGFTQ